MTHATRDTTTGLLFEEKVQIKSNGINLSKYNLYKYLKNNNINYKDYISKKLLPDEAYFDLNTKVFSIYEKKFQQVPGSADEKPQTCAFKIWEFQKIGKAIGAETVTYTYVFNDWFKKDEYKDMLEYIKSVPGCDYFFMEE
jgi:hypothetical protein